jgi:hypothetical protein
MLNQFSVLPDYYHRQSSIQIKALTKANGSSILKTSKIRNFTSNLTETQKSFKLSELN